MFWMRAYKLHGEVGVGWALEFLNFLDPVKWEPADRRVPFGAQKNSGIPGSNPLPLPQVMDMHTSKTLCTGLYKSQVHRLFYAHEPPGDFNLV